MNGSNSSPSSQGRTLLGLGGGTEFKSYGRKQPSKRASILGGSASPRANQDAQLPVDKASETQSSSASSPPPEERNIRVNADFDATKWQTELVSQLEARQRANDSSATSSNETSSTSAGSSLPQSAVPAYPGSSNAPTSPPSASSNLQSTPGTKPLQVKPRSSLTVQTPDNTSSPASSSAAKNTSDDEAPAYVSPSGPAKPRTWGKANRRGMQAEDQQENKGGGFSNRRSLLASTFEPVFGSPSSTNSGLAADDDSADLSAPSRRRRGIMLNAASPPAGPPTARRRRRDTSTSATSSNPGSTGDAFSMHSADTAPRSFIADAFPEASSGRDSPLAKSTDSEVFEAAPSSVGGHDDTGTATEIFFAAPPSDAGSDAGSILLAQPARAEEDSVPASRPDSVLSFGSADGSEDGKVEGSVQAADLSAVDFELSDEDDEPAVRTRASVIQQSAPVPVAVEPASSRQASSTAAQSRRRWAIESGEEDNASAASVYDDDREANTVDDDSHSISGSTQGSASDRYAENTMLLTQDAPHPRSTTTDRSAAIEPPPVRSDVVPPKVFDSNSPEMRDWEQRVLKADWEELEVARYLNEFGKNVHMVRSIGNLDSSATFGQHDFPNKFDYMDFSGDQPRLKTVAYYVAFFTALASYVSPGRMEDIQQGPPIDEVDMANSTLTPDEFRWQALQANGERLYYSALPLYEAFGSTLRQLWRWESKSKTFLALCGYTLAWWNGLLFSSAIFIVIMVVLSLKTYPPQPDILREIIARQRRRQEEASILAQDPTLSAQSQSQSQSTPAVRRSRYGLAMEATRNYGLQASSVASALADGHERAKNFSLWRSPRATWRLLLWLSILFFASLPLTPAILIRTPGAVLGICFFFIAPIAEYKPHWLGVEWANPFEFIFAGVPNDAQYSVEILRQRASKGKPLITDTALLLRPEVAASTTPAPASVQNGVNWKTWSDRILAGKSLAIRGSEIVAGSRTVSLPRAVVAERTQNSGFGSAVMRNLSKGWNLGMDAIESKSSAIAAAPQPGQMTDQMSQDEADVDGTYWAVFEGCCGHLLITPELITFRSLFARRPRGRRGVTNGGPTAEAASSSTDDFQPILDPQTGGLTIPESELQKQQPKVRVLFEGKVADLQSIEKLDSSWLPYAKEAPASGVTKTGTIALGRAISGQGLKLTLRPRDKDTGKRTVQSVEIYQVVKRNEAFNRLVAVAPKQWKKVY